MTDRRLLDMTLVEWLLISLLFAAGVFLILHGFGITSISRSVLTFSQKATSVSGGVCLVVIVVWGVRKHYKKNVLLR